jgi:hypothetical protein
MQRFYLPAQANAYAEMPWEIVPRLATAVLTSGERIRGTLQQDTRAFYQGKPIYALRQTTKNNIPAPNESTLLTIPISETTISGSTQLDSGQLSCERSIQLHSQTTHKPHKEPESGNPSYASIPCGAACKGSTTDLGFPSIVEGQDPDSKVISKRELSQGIVLHESIDPGGSSACYIAGPIKLTIEYATGLEGIKYSVEWLTAAEMKDLQSRAHPTFSVDVGSLASEISIRNHNSVCILLKGTALRLDWELKSYDSLIFTRGSRLG